MKKMQITNSWANSESSCLFDLLKPVFLENDARRQRKANREVTEHRNDRYEKANKSQGCYLLWLNADDVCPSDQAIFGEASNFAYSNFFQRSKLHPNIRQEQRLQRTVSAHRVPPAVLAQTRKKELSGQTFLVLWKTDQN